MKYGIMSIPTLLMFKNGELIDAFIGAMPEPMLKAKIESNFNFSLFKSYLSTLS